MPNKAKNKDGQASPGGFDQLSYKKVKAPKGIKENLVYFLFSLNE